MSLYERWRMVSYIIFALFMITLWFQYRTKDSPDFAKWSLRHLVLAIIFWTGWLIADLSHHDHLAVGLDAFLLAVNLLQFWNWWNQNKRKQFAEWLGYKGRALRAKLIAAPAK